MNAARAGRRPGATAGEVEQLEIDPMGDALAVSPAGLVAVREWVFYTGPGGSSRDVITSPDKSISIKLSGVDGHAKLRAR